MVEENGVSGENNGLIKIYSACYRITVHRLDSNFTLDRSECENVCQVGCFLRTLNYS